jgi:hypothetical protein
MNRAFAALADAVQRLLSDVLLPNLLVGVILAALFIVLQICSRSGFRDHNWIAHDWLRDSISRSFESSKSEGLRRLSGFTRACMRVRNR